MKLFQQLLVAPAALGLMAPMAATAAELNINDVSNYSASGVVTESISNFSDVYPSDWAYQALNSLRKRSGCTAASPSGSMTRYEAAALLNKCLSNISQVNEEEQSLVDEFSAELAVIQGRLDVLENDINGFEAGVFSSTTKLSGKTTFIVGSVDSDSIEEEATTFTYDTQIALDSSFSGSDLLKTVIRAGNTTDTDPFSNSGTTPLEATAADPSESTNLSITRSYYQFPIGDDFTATVGARVRQDDMLGVWPSAYPGDSVLDVLTYAGANAAYALTEGAGAGVTYAKNNLSASLLFVSEDANNASSGQSEAGGIGTAHGSDDITGQVAWVQDGLTLAAVYTSADNGNTNDAADSDDYTAWGLSGVYEIDNDSAFIPTSISAGIGWMTPDNENDASNIEDETTWSFGLLWSDVGFDGNTLGFAYGTAEGHRDDSGYDDPMAYEVYYSIPVSDNITVTPAFFTVEKNGGEDDVSGALVKTTFTF